jgi:heptosyltransferase-2
MLTDRLIPRRAAGEGFLPVPTRDYYLGIARYLGATSPDPAMRVFTTPRQDAAADALLAAAGYGVADTRPLLLLNPGAQKPEKRWPAVRFAQIADRCEKQFGAVAAVTGSPKEKDVLGAVVGAAKGHVINLAQRGMTLGVLKSVIRRAAVLLTNDTGPRHMAAALDVPVVTLFGPTGPEWTEIDFAMERKVVVRGPGGDRKPADLERGFLAMDRLKVEPVFEAISDLLSTRAGQQVNAGFPMASHRE